VHSVVSQPPGNAGLLSLSGADADRVQAGQHH